MSQADVPSELLEDRQRIRVQTLNLIDSSLSNTYISTPVADNVSKTPGQAKNYFEFVELVEKAVRDFEEREQAPYRRKLDFSWERPNKAEETERITISLLERKPGVYAQGAPGQGSVRNQRPILRQKVTDKDNPGYNVAVMGKTFDNHIGFTLWAQTNKEAIERAFWFEDLMEKYTWYFRASGVGRVLFYSQEEDSFEDNDGQKIYGRRLVFFVRTERITELSEKTVEEIFVNLSVGTSTGDK